MVPSNLPERRRIVSFNDGEGQDSSLKCKDTVPVKAKVDLPPQMLERRDTHCHVDPCVHDEALLFGANGYAGVPELGLSLRGRTVCNSV